MINLCEIADKLERVLNGTPNENELNEEWAKNVSPVSNKYYFVVKTQGFHLDRIYDMKSGKNFIPVFVSLDGGSYNPVADIQDMSLEIGIALYFPIQFKDEFFKLNEYLANAFVGQLLSFGDNNGICNISVAQYGEFDPLDLTQFRQWIENNFYKKPIETQDLNASMTLTLYISSAKSMNKENGFISNNSTYFTLTYKTSDNEEISYTPKFVEGAFLGQSDPSVEQILGAKESQGLGKVTAFGSSFNVYVEDNDFFNTLIKDTIIDGKLQDTIMTLEIVFGGFKVPLKYKRKVFISSINIPIEKGSLMSMTLSFSKSNQESEN